MTTQSRLCIQLAFLIASVPIAATAQPARPTQTAHALADTNVTDSLMPSPTVQRIRPKRQRFWFENGVTNVYDSNIEHDSTNLGSYGIVVGANGRFRTRSSKPGVQLEYGIAVHQYTATDRFDRVSQLGRAGLDMPVSRRLLLGLIGEILLKGSSSEDREIGDQYTILPRVEMRPTDNTRFRIITAYRKRYYGAGSVTNAKNRYITFDSRIRLSSGTLEGSARFEENVPKLARLRFKRQTYTGRYGLSAGDRNALMAGLEYRPVQYPERTVDIVDDEGETIREEIRRDRRWKPELSWTREWTRNLRTELEYEYEMRLSNDPDKKYRGHVLTLNTAFPW